MPIVRDLLAKKGHKVMTTTRQQTVLEAARLMNEARIGALCVVDGEKVVGMFTERDILCRIVAETKDPASTRVSDVMTSPVVTCGPDAKLADCAAVMSQKKIRHLPVVDGGATNGRLIGLISTGDLMAQQVTDKQNHIDHLHDYLHGRA